MRECPAAFVEKTSAVYHAESALWYLFYSIA